MMVHTFNPSSWAVESGFSKLQTNQRYTVRPVLKKGFISNFVKIFFIKMCNVNVQQTDLKEIRFIF